MPAKFDMNLNQNTEVAYFVAFYSCFEELKGQFCYLVPVHKA